LRSGIYPAKNRREKTFDKRLKMVSLVAGENENHVRFNAEARACQWLHVHLAA
jgi:hypothetical protein